MAQQKTKEPRSCGFLIVKGNPIESFLLMKHADRWDLPKGHVDPGETDLQCALRELDEETGIQGEDIGIDPDFSFESRYIVSSKRYGGGKGSIEKSLRIFLGILIRDVQLKPTEHLGFEWFPWEPTHRIQERAIDPLLAYLEEFLNSRAG